MFARIFTIIMVFLLTSQIISAQKTITQVVGRMNYENKKWSYQNSPKYVKNIVFNYSGGSYSYSPKTTMLYIDQINFHQPIVLNQSFYFDRLSFFCHQEYKFEKNTKVPLRFRLGSLNYTNYLEQKLNALKSF